jgi:minor curlin subunit
MLGRSVLLFHLLLIGFYLTPVQAVDDITPQNSDSTISENKTISPNNERIRSVLNARSSDNEISSIIQTGNAVSIYQRGSNNTAQIRQKGLANQAYNEQFGAQNESKIIQAGKNNFAEHYQSGIGNTVISIQHGNNNQIRQIQQGNGINSRITQSGNSRILIR